MNNPSVIYLYYPNGNINEEKYFTNNKLHREDGPARIFYYPSGIVQSKHYIINEKFHRENGPARILYYLTGKIESEEYCINGIMYRENGPSLINYYENGNIKEYYWYINNMDKTKEINKWIKKNNIELNKDKSIKNDNDKILFKLIFC